MNNDPHSTYEEKRNVFSNAAFDVVHFSGSFVKNCLDGINAIVSFFKPKGASFLPFVSPRVESPSIPQREEKPIIEETPADTDAILDGIIFEDEGEQSRARVYVRNFRSESLYVRHEALKLIKSLSRPAALQILRHLLIGEKNPLKIAQLLNLLSYLDESGVVEKSVFTRFLKHDNPNIRITAIRAALKYVDEDGFSILTESLKDPDPYVRKQALNLMCWNYRKQCNFAVLKLLHDSDNFVRKSAIRLCGALKIPETVSILILLLKDSDREIQKSANEALQKITRMKFDFSVSASQKNKDKSVEAWQKWWNNNQSAFGLQLRKESPHGH